MPATPAAEPNPLLLFALLFVLVLGVIGAMAFISRAKAWLNGEPFLSYDRLQGVNRFSGQSGTVISRPLPGRVASSEAHARTGAEPPAPTAPDSTAVRAASEGACVREGEPVIRFSSHQAQQAARRMIRHKLENPNTDMLNTIRAGFPEIKSRSGDPSSKYQRYGKPLYDALFAEPEPDLPYLTAQRQQPRWEPAESAVEKP